MTTESTPKKPSRVMSGMRTTSTLHIGNYFGALKNWVELQKDNICFFGAMNWHALTEHYKTPETFTKFNREIISDWIAYGIDPEKSVIFVQSEVPGLLELNMIFSLITPIPWLERVTTWKDAVDDMKAKDAHNLGRFAYPVLQAADIAIFRGIQVPVGQDQVPHLELAREIVRRFNHLYKTKLPEPQPLLTETPMITGTDGRKMSKSYGNVIPLLDEPKNIEKICKQMITDPQRVRRDDPGNPDVCSVFAKHKLFSSAAEVSEVDRDCRSAALGCGDCKLKLAANINAFMAKPLSIKKELLNSPSRLDEIIAAGNLRAAAEAERTMEIVRPAALGLKSKGSR